MSINIDNYEQYVIDYLDGNLDEIKSGEMAAFLLLHPAIAEDLDGLSAMKLESEVKEPLNQYFISQLKKTEIIATAHIHEDNYEALFIAKMENDLSLKEIQELERFLILNPDLNKELKLVESLKLQPDNNLHFPRKERLKRKARKVVLFWPGIASIAAAFIWAFWVLWPQPQSHPIESLAGLNSIYIQQIQVVIPQEKLSLPIGRKKPNEEKFSLSDDPMHERTKLAVLRSTPVQAIVIEDERWRNTLLLMQSYVFERTQMYSVVDWSQLPEDHKTSAFRMITAALWKTTKGQIKNVGEQVMNEDMRFWKPEQLSEFSEAYQLMKRKTKTPKTGN
jgi:hypothetical protein